MAGLVPAISVLYGLLASWTIDRDDSPINRNTNRNMNRKQRRQMARLEPASAFRPASNPSAQRVADLFARAVQHFQAGRLIEAMELYQQALLSDPKHIGSLHHLGLVAIKIGRPEIAVDLIEQ